MTLHCGTEIAGAMSDPESDKDKMNGSFLVVEAENAAAVRAVLEKDIFWANSVVSSSMTPATIPHSFGHVPLY